jgi:hypothetical protein
MLKSLVQLCSANTSREVGERGGGKLDELTEKLGQPFKIHFLFFLIQILECVKSKMTGDIKG